ncbi:group II intron maturase-specific domain-containing protein [Nonomuraea antimicrobica]
MKAKIRALTHRSSQMELGYVLTRLNQVMHDWANYFRHAVAKGVFCMLENFAWRRVIRMLQTRHRWNWTDVRRRFATPGDSGSRSRRARSRCVRSRRSRSPDIATEAT